MAGDPVTYVVTRIEPHYTGWLAMAAAWRYVERCGYGATTGKVYWIEATFRGLPITTIGDDTEQVSAQVIESRGVWRPGYKGPWLDGFGREVSDEDIAPTG